MSLLVLYFISFSKIYICSFIRFTVANTRSIEAHSRSVNESGVPRVISSCLFLFSGSQFVWLVVSTSYSSMLLSLLQHVLSPHYESTMYDLVSARSIRPEFMYSDLYHCMNLTGAACCCFNQLATAFQFQTQHDSHEASRRTS